MIASSSSALRVTRLASVWAAVNLHECYGFTIPTQQQPAGAFSRTTPVLRFREDGPTLAEVEVMPVDVTAAALQGSQAALVTEAVLAPAPLLADEGLAAFAPAESLRPLTFADDIEDYLDISTPYYALENEHAIVDVETGQPVGFVCTAKPEMAAGRESGVPFADAGRHMAVAGTVAALLRNPQKKRFHYLADEYTYQYDDDEHLSKERVKEELGSILAGPKFLTAVKTSDLIIFVRCEDFSKRKAKCAVLLGSSDSSKEVTSGKMTINYSIVSAAIFKKLHPPPPSLVKSDQSNESNQRSPLEATNSPKNNKSYSEVSSELDNIKSYADIYGEWLTMEATLPQCKPSDCLGHFYNNPALPHSIMVFHLTDLLGKTISEFTGRDLPFKRSDFGQEHGIQMVSWKCTPENLHFPDTYGLKLQAKVLLDKGTLGEPGSTYSVQCMMKQEETGTLCYKATGRFILEPIKFLRTEFRRVICNRDFGVLWNKLDINGDGRISRDELKQFVRSSRMTELDDEEFDILFRSGDTDMDGLWSYEEVVNYLDSLQKSYKEDFSNSIKKFLKNGSYEELTTLWSKMDLNGDGVVSMEELENFVTSEMTKFSSSSEDIEFLHRGIDFDRNGMISFHEFESYLHAVRASKPNIIFG